MSDAAVTRRAVRDAPAVPSPVTPSRALAVHFPVTSEEAARICGQEAPAYGWCAFCQGWTYSGLWRGACGDCRWRWTHYPDTMPAVLAAHRAGMPPVCSPGACSWSNCPRYGAEATS